MRRSLSPSRSSLWSLAPLLLTPALLGVGACGGNVTPGGNDTINTDKDAGPLHLTLPDAGSGRDTGTRTPPGVVDGSTGQPDVSLPPLGLTVVPLAVCVPSQYTATVTLGGNATFQMALDTGSTTLGVASVKCTDCGVAPVYTPGKTASDTNQTGMSQYGTGSWSGEIYGDSVGLGGGATAPVDLVAIDSQSQFFEPTMCDSKIAGVQGIIGFGPSASAIPGTNAYFDQLVATRQVPDTFATELCDTSGTLWLGGYDPTFTTAAPQYTPLAGGILSQYYYSVNLASITVAGVSVPIATPQYSDSVVDTGTSIFILPTTAFNAIANAIAATPGYQTVFGTGPADAGTPSADGGTDAAAPAPNTSWFSNPDNCVQLSATKAELDAMLPPLTLVFGSNPGIEVQALPTESYLQAYDGSWCPSLYATDPGPDFPIASIIGSPVLRSNIVIFDRANQRIGFAPHTACD